jgi:hypothetical protein
MMRKMILMFFVTLLFTFAAASVIQVARGQQGGDANTISRETQGENLREIVGMGDAEAARAPHIGFIDSPSATCYQPDPGIDACHLTWYYLAVDAAPNYMITMTLSLNAIGAVAHTQGFFQTSMYIPYNMLGKGVKVACGAPGAGGNPQLGNAYAYTIRARDSAGLSSANYGTAYCPAFQP